MNQESNMTSKQVEQIDGVMIEGLVCLRIIFNILIAIIAIFIFKYLYIFNRFLAVKWPKWQ